MAVSVEKRDAIIASYKEKKILLQRMLTLIDQVIAGDSESNACLKADIKATTWRRFLDSKWELTAEEKEQSNKVIMDKMSFWEDAFLSELLQTDDVYVLDDFYKSYEYALGTLKERDANIIRNRFEYGKTLEEIGHENGDLTRERIRQLIANAFTKLSKERLCVEKFLYGFDYTDERMKLIDVASKRQQNDALLQSIQSSDTENINKLREALMSKPLSELHLSKRSTNCMKQANIKTVGELYGLSYNDLINIKNLGTTSVAELKNKMTSIGILNWPEY